MLTLALVVGPFAAPGASAAGACSGVTSEGDWRSIAAPEFSTGPQELKTYAVDPRRPTVMWVTNGATVMRSADGGCSWKESFKLELLPSLDVPISSALASITSIVVPEDASARRDVFLLVEERLDGSDPDGPTGPIPGGVGLRPHVVTSDDDGASWVARDQGLPPVGDPRALHIAPSDGDVAYVFVGGDLYATVDGGTSWQQRGSHGGISDFAIDTQNPDDLWMWAGALYHSLDGGRSSAVNNYVPNFVTHASVYRPPGGEARIMAYDSDGGSWWRSDDSGRTFVPNAASPSNNVISIATGAAADAMVLSVHGAMYRYQAPGGWIEITKGMEQGLERDPDAPDILELSVDRTQTPSVFGRTANTIVQYTAFSLNLPPLDPTAPEQVGGDTALTPGMKKLEIRRGESRKVTYDLTLPPQATPLDVFFLLDTTQSMTSSIRGLQQGIHRIAGELARSKLDVQFGIGEYKDYPIPGYGDPTALDFPYRMRRDIGPADNTLVTAIEQMTASGGGRTHIPESQLTALYQAATGEGEPGCTSDATGSCVPPGQGASFRPDALKVMVNITDAAFENSPAHPSPPFDQVAETLRNKAILQIGLAVYGPYGITAARNSLTEMAAASDTLAPSGGVDCNDDGYKDLEGGAPLVCDIAEEESDGVLSLAPAIIATLKAITDEAPIELVPVKGAGLIESVKPALYPTVNVKDPVALSFDVTYACPTEGAPRGPVELVATVRNVGVASADATVVCKGEPKVKDKILEKLPPIVPPLEPIGAVAVAPVPPPPPAPVSNVQPQPNPHLQGAAAQQEQQEKQLAFATNTHEELETDLELEFSMYRDRSADGAAALGLLAGAMIASTAAGLVLRSRLERNPARRRSN
jgi:hypothetical protein